MMLDKFNTITYQIVMGIVRVALVVMVGFGFYHLTWKTWFNLRNERLKMRSEADKHIEGIE